MKDSAYIAALVRGHVAANPPLATHELAGFKTAVSILAAFGRIFARTAGKPRRWVFCRGSYSKISAVPEPSFQTWSDGCMCSPGSARDLGEPR